MSRRSDTVAAAAELAVFHHALVGAAEEMGEVLKRTAYSPNIKERQDYSCALFDAKGRLLAQAAHLPVHLGSMPASVAAAIAEFSGVFTYDDFVILNDPFMGGTHLPDITMVHPVFDYHDRRAVRAYVACRAHHADIGGAAPGSMAPQTDLIAEGFVIPPTLIAREENNQGTTSGQVRQDILGLILANTRTPDERKADLWAQLAACDRGRHRIYEIEKRSGPASFAALADQLLGHSRLLMQANLRGLKAGRYTAEDVIEDDGAGTRDIAIRLKLTVSRNRLRFDFTGSAAQVRGGVNAVKAVTESAAFYAALCFCENLPPINAGCFDCIDVIAPEGTVVNARRPAAVAGGNVETSQRIVDVCLAALGQAAGRPVAKSQGTMNNLTIGGDGFTYYETIGGGCGADARARGADASHSHMTNTLNTPVEALEHAYPLRVEEYALRKGSGGKGRHRGGDGVIRRVRALAHSQFAILSERRRLRPDGSSGGKPGAAGENTLIRKGGKRQKVPGKCQGELEPGDAIEIRTPGGGGCGT